MNFLTVSRLSGHSALIADHCGDSDRTVFLVRRL